jgi:hypothetical protein
MFPIDDNATWEKNAASLKQLHRLRDRIRVLEDKLITLRDSPKRSEALSPTDLTLRDSPKRSEALSPTDLILRDSP